MNARYRGGERTEPGQLESPGRHSGTDANAAGVGVVVSASNPGLQYDLELGRIVAWSGGTSLYSYDAEADAWEMHGAAPTNSVTPTGVTASGGTYGRFAYSQTSNVYVLVNDASQNVFVYRMSEGSGTPPDGPDPEGTTGDGGTGSEGTDSDGGEETGESTTSGGSDTGNDSRGSTSGTAPPEPASDSLPSAQDDDAEGEGCACTSGPTPGPTGALFGLIALGLFRRRRP